MRPRYVALALALATLGCVSRPPDPYVLHAAMAHRNGSPMDGSATLDLVDSGKHLVRVSLTLDGVYIPENRYPAGIYRARCADTISAKPAFSLEPVMTGRSQTTLEMRTGSLSDDYVVVVFSPTKPGRVLSCGVIKP